MGISKVLIVDDDANIRLIAVIGLESNPDWTVIEAGSGQEALQVAGSESPDLILLDMMMPDMGGTEVYRELQANEKTASIPVIFMTARVQTHEQEAYRQLGVAGVIHKPFDPVKLSEQILSIINGA